MSTPSFSELLRHPVHFAAFGFGAGLMRRGPGTYGTLVAIPVYLLIQHLALPYYLGFLVVTFAVGVYLCGATTKAMGVHDHSGIVWDEMVGYWLTMLLAPSGWFWVALGFFLFRVFDIFKPWPIGWLDRRVHGGLGIMVDDIVAAIYAAICLQAIAWGIAAGHLTPAVG